MKANANGKTNILFSLIFTLTYKTPIVIDVLSLVESLYEKEACYILVITGENSHPEILAETAVEVLTSVELWDAFGTFKCLEFQTSPKLNKKFLWEYIGL